MDDYTALREAAALLDEHAASVRMTHTIGPAYNDWAGESEARADHDRHAALASSLHSIDAELNALREDAGRWRYVRRHWAGAQVHFNRDKENTLKSLVLTIKTAHMASEANELEQLVDAALARETKT